MACNMESVPGFSELPIEQLEEKLGRGARIGQIFILTKQVAVKMKCQAELLQSFLKNLVISMDYETKEYSWHYLLRFRAQLTHLV